MLRCGVAHTGQRHQYQKLVDVAESRGRPPRALFVFFYYNDIANDYAHPHSTVIAGWQVDTVSLDPDGLLVRSTAEELDDRVELQIAEMASRLEKDLSPAGRARAGLRQYSLSAHITHLLWGIVRDGLSPSSAGDVDARARGVYDLPLDRDGRVWYADNDYAAANRQAIEQIRRYCESNGTELVFVLVPPAQAATDAHWHAEVRQFLAEASVAHVDLALRFAQKGLTARDLYWPRDGHLNPVGNAAVAEILLEDFSGMLVGADPPTISMPRMLGVAGPLRTSSARPGVPRATPGRRVLQQSGVL